MRKGKQMNHTPPLRHLPAVALAATMLLVAAAPAEAFQFTSSSKTKDSAVIYNFRTSYPISEFRIGVDLLGSPNLTAMLGRADYIPGAQEEISWLAGGGLNFGYHFPLQGGEGLIGIGVTPFVGYRHLAAFTDNYNRGVTLPPFNVAGITQIGGIDYGARLDIELPSNFFAYAGLGAWTLTNGGWDRRVDSSSVSSRGSYSTKGMTLPRFWLGAGWSPLPIFTAFIGYNWMQLPTGMRGQRDDALTISDRTSIGSFEVGLQLLWFSI